MSRRPTPTISMSDDLLEQIHDQLDYNDSRAAWIREACRQRLAREKGIDPEEVDLSEHMQSDGEE